MKRIMNCVYIIFFVVLLISCSSEVKLLHNEKSFPSFGETWETTHNFMELLYDSIIESDLFFVESMALNNNIYEDEEEAYILINILGASDNNYQDLVNDIFKKIGNSFPVKINVMANNIHPYVIDGLSIDSINEENQIIYLTKEINHHGAYTLIQKVKLNVSEMIIYDSSLMIVELSELKADMKVLIESTNGISADGSKVTFDILYVK